MSIVWEDEAPQQVLLYGQVYDLYSAPTMAEDGYYHSDWSSQWGSLYIPVAITSGAYNDAVYPVSGLPDATLTFAPLPTEGATGSASPISLQPSPLSDPAEVPEPQTFFIVGAALIIVTACLRARTSEAQRNAAIIALIFCVLLIARLFPW